MLSYLKKLKRRNFLIILTFLLFALSLFLLKNFVFSEKKTSLAIEVKRGVVNEELILTGKIDAEEHVVLQFPTGGYLAYVGVKKGENVKKFQTLASLDTQKLKKELSKELNNYLKTRWDFEQDKDDYKNKIVTDEIKRILEKSQFDLNNSVLDVEIQDLAVKFASVTTPIDGLVIRIDSPYAGVQIYTPAQAQIEIVNPLSVFFSLSADQTEVIKINKGQKVSITLDSFPAEKIEGIVEDVSFAPKKDETNTIYEVKILLNSVNNSGYKYRLGMTGDASFITNERKNVLYIPSGYVKSDLNGQYVFSGEKKKKVYVKTGLETDSNTEITQGLKEGDFVYD